MTSSGGATFTAADGQVSTRTAADAATTYSTGSYVEGHGGNAATGAYSMYRSRDATATTFQSGSVGVTVDATNGWSDAADSTWLATILSAESSTAYRSGNSSTGAYDLGEGGSSTATVFSTATARGLDSTSTAVSVSGTSLHRQGNSSTGTFTLTHTASSDRTLVHAEGTDARGTYAAGGSDDAASTTTGSGNDRLGTGTATTTASGSSTVTTTGADYTRTLTGGFDSTATELASDFTGLREAVTTATGSATTRESGVRAGTSYTLTHSQNSTATTAEHANVHTGQYTLTRDGTSESSLRAVGTETAGSYTLDKTEAKKDDSTTRGNHILGLYTLDGTSGSTSTAVETLVHGSHGSTFTEILTEDGTASEAGNAHGGDYNRHDWGGRSADFVQHGTNADGSYHVTEGSAGTFDRAEIGNRHTGGYSLRETSHTDHGFTLKLDGSETWTLTGTGDDTMTAVEVGDRITGDYTKDESGTDGYTLTEWGTLTGGGFTQTVTGSDGYDTSWDGNHAKGTYERETIGGGTWTRTGMNAGTGVNDYTLSLTGDELAGHFSADMTGTTRYDLVERFSDVSNTEPGLTTPGNVSFHSHGLPFRDPVWTPQAVLEKLRNEHPEVYQWYKERGATLEGLELNWFQRRYSARSDGQIVNGKPVLYLALNGLSDDEAVEAIVAMTESWLLDKEIRDDFKSWKLGRVDGNDQSQSATRLTQELANEMAGVTAAGARVVLAVYATASTGAGLADVVIQLSDRDDLSVDDLLKVASRARPLGSVGKIHVVRGGEAVREITVNGQAPGSSRVVPLDGGARSAGRGASIAPAAGKVVYPDGTYVPPHVNPSGTGTVRLHTVTDGPIDLARKPTGTVSPAYNGRRPGQTILSSDGYGGTFATSEDVLSSALTKPTHGSPMTALEKMIDKEIPLVAKSTDRLSLNTLKIPESQVRFDPHKFGADQVKDPARWVDPTTSGSVERTATLRKFYDEKLGIDRWYIDSTGGK